GDEYLREEALLLFGLGLDLDAVLDQVPDHPDIAGAVGDVGLLVGADPADRAALDRRGLDLARLRLVHELGIGHRVARALARVELLDDDEDDQADDQPDPDILQHIVQGNPYGSASQHAPHRAGPKI